jgi:hypothetical protein
VALASTCRLPAAGRSTNLKRIALGVGRGAPALGDLDADAWAGRLKVLGRQINAALTQFGFFPSLLTERECLVAQYMLRGHSIRSLAERLGISEDTVKTHRKHVYSKLTSPTVRSCSRCSLPRWPRPRKV